MTDEYDIVKAFAAIEKELMSSMIRNLKRHKAEEDEMGMEWSMWQTMQLEALEKYKKENQRRFKKQFQDLNKEIEELIRIANEEGGMDQEIEILEAIKNGFFEAKKASQGMTAEFFRLNERKLDALIEATVNDMQNAETAILRMANDQYRKVIYNAQVYANSGAGTYERAVDMATRDFLRAGLNCVVYANGARHTLSDYADMALRTASKRAYLQGEGVKRQEWGIHTVIMNKRGNPCPKCLPFCGKVLIDDVWSGGSKKDGPYPLMSKAVEAGLYHPRCKDSHTTYFPGISTVDGKWTKEELDTIGEEYRQEEWLNYAKRQAEKYGRMAEFSLDQENQRTYHARAEEWQEQEKGLLRKIKESISPEYKESLKQFKRQLKTVTDEDTKMLLEESSKRTQFKLSERGKAYYSPKDRTVYLTEDSIPSTIAHELFHEIDHKYEISKSGVLTKPIQSDYRRLKNMARGYGKPLEDMLYSRYPQLFKKERSMLEACRGISDILNGMSKGEIWLGYGHDATGYWDKPLRIEKETWAQYGRMFFEQDKDVLRMLEELFPETTQSIMTIIEEMMK